MSDNPTNGASGAPDAQAGGETTAASGADAARPDDIAIEVETGSASAQSSAASQTGGDDEIAVEVDTRESEAAERIIRLEAEKAQLDKERLEHWDRLVRTTADFDNYRKRARRDIDDARIDAHTKVLRPMLEVIDNLERAVDHAESVDDPGKAHTAVLDGVKLVLRQFVQVLERFDVKQIEALGKPFDPTVHEAISQIETAAHEPGAIVQAPQKGYTIGERLLRPALVIVAKAPPAADTSSADPAGDASSAGPAGDASSAGPAGDAGDGAARPDADDAAPASDDNADPDGSEA